ncbi:hypothetical protein [Alicyclobacillus sp. SO9]|uniref:hypothetical protein n=1 Tax=Alicyclobacillus sp. SO9 TaxID=2665646 RepID=UPI0018E87722|nr:hypothetical protein [Alicyclobacillus sp. SO9]QQE78705.1 hypothetical protein GI364_23105 [Alicyclobacillus sp. SO9]
MHQKLYIPALLLGTVFFYGCGTSHQHQSQNQTQASVKRTSIASQVNPGFGLNSLVIPHKWTISYMRENTL